MNFLKWHFIFKLIEMYIVMFSPVFHLWIIKCHSNTKKMRYYLLISDKYKGFKLANRKSQLNLKALYDGSV